MSATMVAVGGAATAAAAEPSVDLPGFPHSAIVDSAYTLFDVTLRNPGATIANARVDVTITGTTDLPGSDIRLWYPYGRFFGVALRGTANGVGGITGSIGGQTAGYPLASGKTTDAMRIGFVAGTPVDTLHVTFALDVIDPFTETPTATLATRTATVALVARSTPSAPDRALTVTSGSTTSFRLTSRNADGIDPRFRHTQPTFGTVRDRGGDGDATLGYGAVAVSELFSYSAPKDFLGTTSFTYTARDPGSELAFDQPPSSTGTITILVTQAPVLLRARLTPPTVTLGTPQKLTITAHTTGAPSTHLIVRLNGPARTRTLVINHSVTTLKFIESRVGAHRITIDYAGTATTEPGSIRLTDSIRRPD